MGVGSVAVGGGVGGGGLEFQNRQPSVLYVFEYKTQNILIHASHTRSWHFDISVIYSKHFVESNSF